MFNGFNNLKYFKCEKNSKAPIGGKKCNLYSLNEINNDFWWGFIIPGDIVVIDVDDQKEAEIIFKLVKENKVKCFIEKSTNGYHFYFKLSNKDKRLRKIVRGQCLLTLNHIDYLTPWSNATIICYKDNGWTNWINYPENGILSSDDLDEIPLFLQPLLALNKKPLNIGSYLELNEGERNQTLYDYTGRLSGLGYNHEEIYQIINLINSNLLAKPLDKNEIDTICRQTEEKDRANSSNWLDDKGRFKHDLMGNYIIKLLNCWKDEGNQLWYYNSEYYTNDTNALETEIVKLAPSLKTNQRKEVLNYLKLTPIDNTFTGNDNHNYIAIKKGYFDFINRKLIPNTPMFFVRKYIDVDWDPNAYDKAVDEFLNDVLVTYGDREQRMIFEEFLGYTIFAKTNFMRKMLLMIGEVSGNGKSTTQVLVQHLLGEANFCALHIHQISEKSIHILPELENKMACLEDDAQDGKITNDNLSYVKSLVSSNSWLVINRKFAQPYKTKINTKFWIASNHIIKTDQKGDEWMSRLLVLAFNNHFPESDMSKIYTKNGKNYLFRLAVEGYNRLLQQGHFTKSKTSENAFVQYRINNDILYQWLVEKDYKIDYLKNKPISDIYGEYSFFMDDKHPKLGKTREEKFKIRFAEWCKDNDMKLKIVDEIIKEE